MIGLAAVLAALVLLALAALPKGTYRVARTSRSSANPAQLVAVEMALVRLEIQATGNRLRRELDRELRNLERPRS